MVSMVGTLGLLLWAWVGTSAAEQPKSVFDLVNRVPDPPSTAKDAVRWFDKEGRMIHPVVLELKEEIEGYRQASQQPGKAVSRDEQPDSLITGLEHVGIDAARLQTDPVYSAEIKEKLENMTMEEKLALAQKILEPQLAAGGQSAGSSERESQAVQAALAIARKFPERQVAWKNGVRLELEKTFQEIPHQVPQKFPERAKPPVEFHENGCTPDCVSQWKAYGKDLWPLVLERETDILRQRRAVLQRYKTFLAEEFMLEGDKHLKASLFGELAVNPENRSGLVQYHQRLLGEILGLVDLTESAAKRAADIVHGGVGQFYGGQ